MSGKHNEKVIWEAINLFLSFDGGSGARWSGSQRKEVRKQKYVIRDYFLMKKLLIYMRLDENFVYEKSKEVQ